jgi:hypothetical protein
MLTIEESSVVMKVAVPERASTTHLFARSAASTGVGVATSACAWREAAWPQSADETTRAIGAERDELDSVPNIPTSASANPRGCFCLLIGSSVASEFTHEKLSRAFRQEPLRALDHGFTSFLKYQLESSLLLRLWRCVQNSYDCHSVAPPNKTTHRPQ